MMISPKVVAWTALWLALVLGGTWFMTQYSETPGASGSAPARWPAESQVPHGPGQPALVVFLHPHCPCSSATVGELALLMARCQGRLSAHVLFLQPEGMQKDWVKTSLWDEVESIPGVSVSRDVDGAESQRFHAETSGQALLYDGEGTLLFQGGITAARGHSGDNEGRTAIEDLIEHGQAGSAKTPVFGCGLFATHCEKGDLPCKP